MRNNCSHGLTQGKFHLNISHPHHHHHHLAHSSTNNLQKPAPTVSTFYNQDVYTKIADQLQKEFKKTSIVKDNQINQLKNRISQMKVQMLELEDSKREDLETRKRIEAQLSQLKLSQNSKISYQISEPRQIVRVEERIVRQDDPQKDKQIIRLKQKNKQIQFQNANLTSAVQKARNQNEQLNAELKYQRQRTQKFIQTLKAYQQQIQMLKYRLKQQGDSVLQLEQKVQWLETESKKVKVQQRQKIVYKHDVKVETIYVQKPVQRIVQRVVYRDVPKVVKQVVRPVVNRIIECKSSKNVQNAIYTEEQVQQFRYTYQQIIESLKKNIKQYQQQRNRLVQAIRDRDSDLHLLQVQLRLLGGYGNTVSSSKGYHQSTVTVQVVKQNQESEQLVKKNQPTNNNNPKFKKSTAVPSRATGSKKV